MAVSLWLHLTIMMIICLPNAIVTSRNVISGWTNKPADVYFLLDSSSSVWIVDYTKMLNFVNDLVSDMDIAPHKTRVGVGVYSAKFHEYIAIDRNRNKAELQKAIADTPYILGNTFISRAIDGVRKVGLSPDKARKGVPLIAVLITDGTSRYKQLTLQNATRAKQEGISLFTVGVGWDVEHDELWSIASDPKADHFFQIPDFVSFYRIKKKLSQKMAAVEFLQKDQRGNCGGDVEADVLFVFDESAIGRKESTKIKAFIGTVVKDLSVDSGKVRVGVVSKTCHEGNDIDLDSYLKAKDFENGLTNSRRGPGLAELLRRAWFEGFLDINGGRNHAKRRIVLILTDPLHKGSDVKNMAFIIRVQFKVEIFVIRIGTPYDKLVLNAVASSPDHVTYFDTTSLLERGTGEFFQNFCIGL